ECFGVAVELHLLQAVGDVVEAPVEAVLLVEGDGVVGCLGDLETLLVNALNLLHRFAFGEAAAEEVGAGLGRLVGGGGVRGVERDLEGCEAGAGGAGRGRGGGEREDDVVPVFAGELVDEGVVLDADLFAVGAGAHRVGGRPAAVIDEIVEPHFGRA